MQPSPLVGVFVGEKAKHARWIAIAPRIFQTSRHQVSRDRRLARLKDAALGNAPLKRHCEVADCKWSGADACRLNDFKFELCSPIQESPFTKKLKNRVRRQHHQG